MPDKICGKKLTAKQHRQFKHVKASTGSYAAATSAVKKSMGIKKSCSTKKRSKKK